MTRILPVAMVLTVFLLSPRKTVASPATTPATANATEQDKNAEESSVPLRRDWWRQPPALPDPPADAIRVQTVEALHAATERVAPGGTILIADGVYHFSKPIELRTDGVTMRAESGHRERVVLDGDNMGELLRVSRCSGVTIAALTLQNVKWNALKINSETGVQRLTVRDCVFHNIWQRAIKGVKVPERDREQLRPAHALIEFCLFANNHPKRFVDDETDTAASFNGNYVGGIDVMYASDWIIRDNIFVGLRGRTGSGRGAIFLWHDTRGCVIERNIIMDCDSGICLGNSFKPADVAVHAVECTVRNNFLIRVPENGIFAAWTRDCRIGHNTVWDPQSKQGRLIRAVHDNPGLLAANNLLCGARLRDESTSPVEQRGNLARDLTSMLMNPAQGDLRLKPDVSSPERAEPLPWVTDDFTGRTRGPRPTIGACEPK